MNQFSVKSNINCLLPATLCDENADVFGFGGSFGVVSPGEKLGDVFELEPINKRMFTLEQKTKNVKIFTLLFDLSEVRT